MPDASVLNDGEGDVSDSKKLRSGLTPGVPHHRNLQDLISSAANCDLCRMIADSVLEVRNIWDEQPPESWIARHCRSGPPKNELHLSARKEPNDGFVVWSVSENNDEVYLVAAVGYCVDDENELSTRFPGRPVSRDPRGAASVKRYRGWLAECEHGHHKCPPKMTRPATPAWPLRLLDISDADGSPQMIKLIEDPPVDTRYATLSHCWGDALHFILEHRTLHEYKQGIELSKLPKTYQDAIFIARQLDIRFLWIDALTICQDDGADWERESAKMAAIYSNAYVSIASSSAASDATGFLDPPPGRKYIDVPVTVKETDKEPAIDSTIKLFSIPNHLAANGTHYIAMDHLPLPRRAWALQERYLSPRTLLFGDQQTFYECSTHFVSEDGFSSEQSWYSFDDGEMEKPNHLGHRHEYYHRKGSKWYTTLNQYSDRKLSRESDKLPALSGIARIFQDMMGGEYVAGLWTSDLVEGLAFQCFGGPHSRPKEWRAPSWSWASIDGMLSVTDLGGWDDLLEVKDVKVEVKGQNPFGEIKSGELRLSCTLEKLTVGEEPVEPGKPVFKKNVRLCFTDEDETSHGHHASFDVKDAREGTHGMDLYGIPLAAHPSGTVYTLLVVPDESDGRRVFSREGYLLSDGKELVSKWREAKQNGNLVDVILI